MDKLRAIFKGRVQGVFFRATVKEYADNFKLKGYVKNLFDGSVEVVVEGQKDLLVQFLEKIKKESGRAVISNVETEFFNGEASFNSFFIHL